MAKSKEVSNGESNGNGQGDSFDVRSLFVGSKSGHDVDRRAVEKLGVEHPLIATILGGIGPQGDVAEVEPGSITFFVREGRIRFSVNVKSADTTIIGEVADAVNPWQSVEYALKGGQVSSKRYSDRPSASKEDQKLLY